MPAAKKTATEAAAPAPAEAAPKAAKPKVHGTLRVICHVARGRRRAGRGWEAGETPVEPDALSAEELAALEADPLFRVERL